MLDQLNNKSGKCPIPTRDRLYLICGATWWLVTVSKCFSPQSFGVFVRLASSQWRVSIFRRMWVADAAPLNQVATLLVTFLPEDSGSDGAYLASASALGASGRWQPLFSPSTWPRMKSMLGFLGQSCVSGRPGG